MCFPEISCVVDVVDGADEGVSVLVGKVGPQQQAVGAERIDGASLGSSGVRCLPRDVVVGATGDHRWRAAEMGQMTLIAGCRCI
jgi:hypothetical protein